MSVLISKKPRKSIHYSLGEGNGLIRKRKGKSFRYFSSAGKEIKKSSHLKRLSGLRIPPAWGDVWINPDPFAHLQATGRDLRGRKQYIYHPEWRALRDETKFHRMIEFGKVLPKIRKRVRTDLNRKELTKQRVLATVVKLLEISLIRVGNDEYAKTNKSYGLTTMLDRHAIIKGNSLTFQFLGKSKKNHSITVKDSRLAQIVKKCRDIPGQTLFQYFGEDGLRHGISSGDVNSYLQAICGSAFTAKDFRTWAGTVLAAMALKEFEKFDSNVQAKRNITRAIESVAKQLGNTPSICRKSYIHPSILSSYLEGTFLETLKQVTEMKLRSSLKELSSEEGMVLAFLEKALQSKVLSKKKR